MGHWQIHRRHAGEGRASETHTPETNVHPTTMKPIYWIILSTFTPILLGQPPGDGCAAAADSLNRVKEKFYANADSLDYRTAYSSMVTATRNCPDWGVL